MNANIKIAGDDIKTSPKRDNISIENKIKASLKLPIFVKIFDILRNIMRVTNAAVEYIIPTNFPMSFMLSFFKVDSTKVDSTYRRRAT